MQITNKFNMKTKVLTIKNIIKAFCNLNYHSTEVESNSCHIEG
jgi:hypothetical protein